MNTNNRDLEHLKLQEQMWRWDLPSRTGANWGSSQRSQLTRLTPLFSSFLILKLHLVGLLAYVTSFFFRAQLRTPPSLFSPFKTLPISTYSAPHLGSLHSCSLGWFHLTPALWHMGLSAAFLFLASTQAKINIKIKVLSIGKPDDRQSLS